MLVLALDTTTRGGSAALARDGALLDVIEGDPAVSHGQRLPGDLVTLLARHGLGVGDVDLFAVAAGPGSFTGLRVGIATVQGLALATDRLVVPVSSLEALAQTACRMAGGELGAGDGIAAWMDAQRGDVFAALYRVRDRETVGPTGLAGLSDVEGPRADTPSHVAEAWRDHLASGRTWFIGDGAIRFRATIASVGERTRLVEPVPPLGPAIAALAVRGAAQGRAVGPHAIQPLYVRRPDAELARDGGRLNPGIC